MLSLLLRLLQTHSSSQGVFRKLAPACHQRRRNDYGKAAVRPLLPAPSEAAGGVTAPLGACCWQQIPRWLVPGAGGRRQPRAPAAPSSSQRTEQDRGGGHGHGEGSSCCSNTCTMVTSRAASPGVSVCCVEPPQQHVSTCSPLQVPHGVLAAGGHRQGPSGGECLQPGTEPRPQLCSWRGLSVGPQLGAHPQAAAAAGRGFNHRNGAGRAGQGAGRRHNTAQCCRRTAAGRFRRSPTCVLVGFPMNPTPISGS